MKRGCTFLFALGSLMQCSDDKELPSPTQVRADFTVSQTAIKVGESVTFTDMSEGLPNLWTWTFDGGEPTSSNEQNPIIKYQVPGSYKVSLKVSNGSSEDNEIKENYIDVEVSVGSFELINETTFGLSVRSDLMQSMIRLEDNSFISVGWTDNENTSEAKENILITKFDKDLNLIWNKVFGGSNADLVRDVIHTNDGGFLISATTESNDGDIPVNYGMGDIMVAKLSGSGDIEWTKTYGGNEYDGVNKSSLLKLENGYAFLGYTKSENAGIAGRVGLSDIWLVEVDNNGNTVNSTAIGSNQDDYPYSFVKSNAGYVVLSKIGGATADFDQAGIWIFETTSDGKVGWKHLIAGVNAGKLIKTQDGGYAMLNTNRNNVTDLFVTKLNDQGGVQWERSFPLPAQEFAQDIIEADNELIILGASESSGGIIGNAFVAKLNASGDVIQSITFGNDKVAACRIIKTDNQKFLVGGSKNVGQSFMNIEFWLQVLSDSD